MGVNPAIFQSGGQASQHYLPGAYSRVDYVKSSSGLSSINNAVIMGDCRGGEPNELLWFSSPSQAEAVLRSGNLLTAIKKAFNPGGGYSPQRLAALRVNPGVQATKYLDYTNAGVVEVLKCYITAAATASANVSIVLNGAEAVTIAVTSGDTPTQVATKIAAGSFSGWTQVSSGALVTWTASAAGTKAGANTFDGGTTGVTATNGIETVREGVTAGDYNTILATAWDYGLHTNQLKIKLEAGTTTGNKITIQFMSETAIVVDNVAKSSFQIQYTGSLAACTMTIDSTGIITTSTGGANDLRVPFASFPTIEDVVNYINDQTDYTCTVLTGTPEDASSELDYIAMQDIKGSAYTAASHLQAVLDAMEDCAWIESAEYNSTVQGRTMPDNVSTWSYFTGGTDGAYTVSEWATSLTALEIEDIQFIGTPSDSAAVHALIKTHCEAMNAVTGKHERQFIVGGASSETVAQAVARAAALNSDAGMLCYPEFKDYNDSGVATWYSPAYYACKLLGMVTCLALSEPLTNKALAVLDVVKLTSSELETLVAGGVCAAYKNSSGVFANMRSITTYQGNTLQRNEFSMMREALYINKDLRNAVESTFIGRAMTNPLLGDVDSIFAMKMKQYEDLGLFNGDPTYSGYLRTVNGDQIIIEFDCNLTPPTNFIFITSHMAVYSTVSA